MAHQFTTSYLEDSLTIFRQYKKLAEGAMAQVTDEQLFAVLDGETNSIAIVVKHMAGGGEAPPPHLRPTAMPSSSSLPC